MPLEVLLFAHLRDAAGNSRLLLPADPPLTVARLRELILAQHPQLAGPLESARVAVDLEFRTADYTIESARAKIALIPPVSGG